MRVEDSRNGAEKGAECSVLSGEPGNAQHPPPSTQHSFPHSFPDAPGLPAPRVSIAIRPANLDDVPFMDRLQKMHTRQVGWMPTAQFHGKIKLGQVLVAVDSAECCVLGAESGSTPLSPQHSVLSTPTPVGYIIGHDQYFKRDDVGIIYQVNVLPGRQRSMVGAALVQAMFDRAAYGCRLFCCWCAQDIEANCFWESLGFVPLAFRTGSRTKGKGGTPRVHIFWQKRIREGDQSTPWWFPFQTSGGSIREDRIVLPIPPGVHWRDAKPVVLPGDERAECGVLGAERKPTKRLPGAKPAGMKPAGATRATRDGARGVVERGSARAHIRDGGIRFASAAPVGLLARAAVAPMDRAVVKAGEGSGEGSGGPKRPREKAKNDPRLIAAARELRDRWLEEVNAGRYRPALGSSKYDLVRALDGESAAGEASRAIGGVLRSARPRLAA